MRPPKQATKHQQIAYAHHDSRTPSDEVLFAIDVEPATTALLDLIVAIRQKLGYKAGKYPNKPYHKGRTARVERHIQNLRRQSLTMIEMVEDRIGEKIPEDHALRAWAIHHAAWLFNRYHLHSGTQSTAFQLVYGRPYQGQILPFGEYVFGLKITPRMLIAEAVDRINIAPARRMVTTEGPRGPSTTHSNPELASNNITSDEVQPFTCLVHDERTRLLRCTLVDEASQGSRVGGGGRPRSDWPG